MVREIPLTQGYVALVDDADFDRASARKWHVLVKTTTQYGRCGRGGSQSFLHRFLMNAQPGEIVDHVNGNGLDCRRVNLRICTAQGNTRNRRTLTGSTSRFKGVRRRGTSAKPWCAQITAEGRYTWLGAFMSEHEAARAYDDAARRLHGEYACLNFPDVECAA